VEDDNSADKELDFSSLSLADLKEFCRQEARENLSLLRTVVDKFNNKSIRQVMVWCMSFLLPCVEEMKAADRRWALLRRTADYVLEAHRN
jgi:type III secretory pathway component EscT